MFVQVVLDILHRVGNDPLIGVHLIHGSVHQVGQILQSTLILLLQSHVLVQTTASGTNCHHQLLI